MTRAPDAPSLFSTPAPRLYSIDPGRPFLKDLAAGVAASVGDDPLALAAALILVPTRRAVRTLAAEFVLLAETRGRRATLLPRIRALADADDAYAEESAGAAEDELALPPAIAPMERLLTLARLVVAAPAASFAGQGDWRAGLAAARELARLLDAFETEEIDPRALATIDVGDHAEHWRQSLRFLSIITERWPAYLDAAGRMDPSRRRAAMISRQAARWRDNPPTHPVIIAGTTGSAPAVARLIGAVAGAPRGAAVLPGFDRSLDPRARAHLEDGHPQAGLSHLLTALGFAPEDVVAFPGSRPSPRQRLLSVALRPAAATDDWRRLVGALQQDDPGLSASQAGLSIVEAENEEAEAAIIAGRLRLSLEDPSATAMLVTPDRGLARRVAFKMRRWGVDIDDSAGAPLSETHRGGFLLLAARWLAAPADPVALIALARHPLSTFGLEAAERENAVDAIDRALRGLAPGPSWARLEARVRENDAAGVAAPALARLADAVRLHEGDAAEGASFAGQARGFIAAAERIAGPAALWRDEDGDAAARLFRELIDCAPTIAPPRAAFAPLIAELAAEVAVRARRDRHPRLSILGPLESRLQSADLVILASLNEGTWPAEPAADAFLSRTMRQAIGLSSPERKLGLSAHDFAEAAAQPVVMLTRSKRADGKPSKPSRWIVRLKNIIAIAGSGGAADEAALAAAMRALDRPERVAPAAEPRVNPGAAHRPRRLYATRVEKLIRDPYSVYARDILRLRKLDPAAEPFARRHVGLLLHKVFERAAGLDDAPDPGALARLLDEEAGRLGLDEGTIGPWRPSLADSLAWFSEFERELRADAAQSFAEIEGETPLEGLSPPFALAARADRLVLGRDGAVRVIDFKTGEIKSGRQAAVFELQVQLIGLIVEAGGFSALGARAAARLDYVKSLNRRAGGRRELARAGEAAAAAISGAREKLRKLIEWYDDPAHPYLSQPRPEFVDEYGDYDALARRKEWGAFAEGDGE